jgi:hypothetical protein
MTIPVQGRLLRSRIGRLLPLVLLGLGLAAADAAAAPVLVTDSADRLLGAENVEVNGALYGVAFVDGTCASVFGVCAPASFAFGSQADAVDAAAALLAQVFVANPIYDDEASLTNGCGPDVDACNIFTPYALTSATPPFVTVARMINHEFATSGSVNPVSNNELTFDTTDRDTVTWARWTLVSVPEPPAAALLTLGLLALLSIGAQRRRT